MTYRYSRPNTAASSLLIPFFANTVPCGFHLLISWINPFLANSHGCELWGLGLNNYFLAISTPFPCKFNSLLIQRPLMDEKILTTQSNCYDIPYAKNASTFRQPSCVPPDPVHLQTLSNKHGYLYEPILVFVTMYLFMVKFVQFTELSVKCSVVC